MIGFVAFSIKRAWQGFWRNGVMSLAATATMILMLLLLSGFWIIQTGLNAGLQFIEQKVEVVADVADTATPDQVTTVEHTLEAMPQVQSVTYKSKDQALADFRQRLKDRGQEDLTGYLDRNPLPNTLEIKLKNPRDFGNVVDYLQGQQGVISRVTPIQKLVDQVVTVTNFLRTAGAVVLALVGLTVLFIIVNTIRLAVFARAEEIEIMRLVGASDAFIRWPFIFEGAMVGLFGAIITLAVLAVVATPLQGFMYGFFNVLPLEFGSLLLRDLTLLVLGAGLGLGILGSYVSVRSYLIR
ncbi:MAG TPA: permease-like cell division protein FtsX [Candidatus Limnocylindrales bacterium]